MQRSFRSPAFVRACLYRPSTSVARLEWEEIACDARAMKDARDAIQLGTDSVVAVTSSPAHHMRWMPT
ncbi:MAG: hypothetical protein ABJM90_01965 [Paracoccaceae bacterium]